MGGDDAIRGGRYNDEADKKLRKFRLLKIQLPKMSIKFAKYNYWKIVK